jgi:hypothetical protein
MENTIWVVTNLDKLKIEKLEEARNLLFKYTLAPTATGYSIGVLAFKKFILPRLADRSNPVKWGLRFLFPATLAVITTESMGYFREKAFEEFRRKLEQEEAADRASYFSDYPYSY